MANTYDLPKNYIKIVEEAKLLPGKPFLRYVQEGQKYLIEKQSLDKYSNQAIIRHTLTIPTMFRTSLMSDMVVFLFMDLFGLFGFYKDKHQFEIYGPALRANAAAYAFDFFCEDSSAHKSEYTSACRELLLERLHEAYPIHCKEAKVPVNPAVLNAKSVSAFLREAPEYKKDASAFLKINTDATMLDWLKAIRLNTLLIAPNKKEIKEMMRTADKLNLPIAPCDRIIETMPTVKQAPQLYQNNTKAQLMQTLRRQLPSYIPLADEHGKLIHPQKPPHNLPEYLIR